MKNLRVIILTLLALVMFFPTSINLDANEVVNKTESKNNTERLGGEDRFHTSVLVSKQAYPNGASTVVLVGGSGEVDALTGTLLAAVENAPMLFTEGKNLTDVTQKEIKRLGAKNVIILGGENVVSDTVKVELDKLELTVERVSGSDRYETAAKVAKRVGKTHKSTHAFLVRGYAGENVSLADALAVGPVSANKKQPVLLVRTDSIPQHTLDVLKELGITNVTIIGGSSAVSDEVETTLPAGTTLNKRIDGKDRYETAVKIAKEFFPNATSALFANGFRSADALIGGYFGNLRNAPILFTADESKTLPPATSKYLKENTNLTGSFLLGGDKVISNSVKDVVNTTLDKTTEKDEEIIVTPPQNFDPIQPPQDTDSQLPLPESDTKNIYKLDDLNEAMNNKNIKKVVFKYQPQDVITISRLVDIDTNGYNLSDLKYELDKEISGNLSLLNTSDKSSTIESLKVKASNVIINIGEKINVSDKTRIEDFGAGSFNTKANHTGEIVISEVVAETISQKIFSLVSKSIFKAVSVNKVIEESSRYKVSIEGNINNVSLKASNVEFSVMQGVKYGEVLIDPGLKNLKINTSNYDNFELLYNEGAKVKDLEGLFNEPIKVVTSRPSNQAIEDDDIIKIDDYNLSVYYTAENAGLENDEGIKIDEENKKIIFKKNETLEDLKSYLKTVSKYSEAFVDVYKTYGPEELLNASYKRKDDKENINFREMRVLLGESESHGLFTLSQVGVEYEKPPKDNVPPTFAIITIHNKNVDLNNQESAKITIEASDNEQILWGIATFVSPNGQVRQEVKLIPIGESDKLEGNITFDKNSQNGEWCLERIQIRDLQANYVAIRVNPENKNWIKESVQITNLVTKSEEIVASDKNGLTQAIINIKNSKDTTPPEYINIYFDKEEVGLHEQLIVTLSAKDNESGLANIAVVELETESGSKEEVELSLLYNSGNNGHGTYKCEYFVYRDVETGLRKIKSITIEDLAGNKNIYMIGNYETLPKFSVLKETNPSDLTFNSIKADSTNIKQGGTVKISISVEETLSISDVWTAEITYLTPKNRRVVVYLDIAESNKFQAEFSVHNYEARGLWKVESITIHNSYSGGQVINNVENNLDPGNFTVTGSNDFDETPPKFTSITIGENSDENLFNIYVQAEDGESGLEKNATLKYASVDDKVSMNINLKLDENLEQYVATLVKTDLIVNYEWKLISITLYDEIGNDGSVTKDSQDDDKLSQGDFSFKNSNSEKLYPEIKKIEIVNDNDSPHPEERFIVLIELDIKLDESLYLSMEIKDSIKNYIYPISNEEPKRFKYYFHKALGDEKDYVFEIKNISSGYEWGTIIYNINKTYTFEKAQLTKNN